MSLGSAVDASAAPLLDVHDADASQAGTGAAVEAASLLQHSILPLEGSDTLILGWAFRELALVQGPTDPVAAEKSLRSSIDYFERGEQPVELAISYRELGDLVRAHGRSTEACELYRVGLDALEPTV